MNKRIRMFLHFGRICLVKCGKIIAGIIPKQNNLILFSAWFGKKYLDSPRFIYEYMLTDKKYDAIWFTKSKEIYLTLKCQGKPVVYGYSIYGLWKQMRAKVLVSTVEYYDFNIHFLNRCILFDIDHGFPIKQSGSEIKTTTKSSQDFCNLLSTGVQLYKTASSTFVKNIIQRVYSVDSSRIVFCNKPRTDVLFDERLREHENECVTKLLNGRRAIVYMPTHRSEGRVEIKIDQIIDLQRVNDICQASNAVFLIKKHFYHRNELIDLTEYECIYDITNENIEVEALTYQADILVSDYSAAYIDYLLLDRPIIFHAYDLELFLQNERDLYYKFNENNAGFKTQTPEEFSQVLERLVQTWKDDDHELGRLNAKRVYFDSDVTIGNSRQAIAGIIDQLIAGTYKPKWGGIE